MTSSVAPAVANQLDWDCPVPLHRLTFLDEGNETTVGRTDIGSYCVLPSDGAALLRRLAAGDTPRAAAEWYHQEYGETADVEEFLLAVDELGFRATDTDPIIAGGNTTARKRHRPAPRHRLPTVRWQQLGTVAFSPIAWLAYGALIVAAIIAMTNRPELAPHSAQLLFTQYLTVLELVLFLGQFPLILIHEGFHTLAGRRLGLPSSLRIGRRLYFVVLETSLDGLVGVPRGKRYLPMLAGMLADLLVIAALTLIANAFIGPDGVISPFSALCLALAFSTVLRFTWQFYFFLRTDLYYVVNTGLRCVNLQQTAKQLLANRWYRLTRQHRKLHDETTWHPHDYAVARYYAWFLLFGYSLAVVLFPLVVIPTMVQVMTSVWDTVAGHRDTLGAIDGIVFLALNIGQILLVFVISRRDRRRAAPTSAHLLG
jgi:hypothetical protein